MSDIKVEGLKTSDILESLNSTWECFSEEDKKKQIKSANGVFEILVKNEEGVEGLWTVDLKKEGKFYKGEAKSQPGLKKADVRIIMADDVFVQFAEGKLAGQKAFMTGKLKTQGNMMLATKLESFFKAVTAKTKAKL